MALAGFTAGEAEGLRRAMSRKRSEAAMMAYQDRFLAGAARNGIEPEVAERVFEQVVGFSGFGFPKAHAAAFGLLAYQSTWLRVHYGPEFLCSLLNEQPMGFYPPDALVHEAQRRGIDLRGVDVNASSRGLRHRGRRRADRARLRERGARGRDGRALAAERERGGPYEGVGDLASRSGVSADALERLAWAGRLRRARAGRAPRGAVAPGDHGRGAAERAPSGQAHRSARAAAGGAGGAAPARARRVGAAGGRLLLDRDDPRRAPDGPPAPRASGRAWRRAPTCAGSRTARRVRVAGLVVARQRPATAKGILFMLLEDEHGTINLIVPPQVYAKHRMVARTGPLLCARGRLEHRGANINVVVEGLERLHRPDLPPAEVRQIEPSVGRETGRDSGAEAARSGGRIVRPSTASAGVDRSGRDLQVRLQNVCSVRGRT